MASGNIHLFLAVRSLLRSRISAALLVLAVAAGVALQIPNAANLRGYSEELMRQGVLRTTGHLLASPLGGRPWQDADRLLAAVRALPFVRGASARLIHGGVVLKGTDYQPARVVGIDVESEDRLTGLCQRISEGSCPSGAHATDVLVGARLAEKLHLTAGDRIKMVLPSEVLGELQYANTESRVAGVIEAGGGFQSDYDLYVSTEHLFDLLTTDDRANSMVVYVDDPDRAGAYVEPVRAALGGARVAPWWDVYEFVARAIEGNRVLLMVSLVMVAFAVAIPVLALLSIHVLHDRKQIALIAALGFSRREILRIHLLKTAIVAIVGSAIGVIGGLALCAVFAAYPLFAYQGFVITPSLSSWTTLLPAGFVMAVTMLAGVWPAVQASRTDPSQNLRGE